MIKDYKYFCQSYILIKVTKPLLILLRMIDSMHPRMDRLQFMLLMADYHIMIYMPKLNNKNYFPSVTELEDDYYKEGPGEDDPIEYISNDEYGSNTEDGITYQEKNRLGRNTLDV